MEATIQTLRSQFPDMTEDKLQKLATIEEALKGPASKLSAVDWDAALCDACQ